MDRDESTVHGGEPHQASQLEELLACERELAELLDEARAEARRIVEAARADAGTAAAVVEASLEEDADRERDRIRAETQARIRELMAEGRERASRFEEVTDERVAALAESAFRRLLSRDRSS